jgi:hypothetical protein
VAINSLAKDELADCSVEPMQVLLTIEEHGLRTLTASTNDAEQLAQNTNLLLQVCIDHFAELQVTLVDDSPDVANSCSEVNESELLQLVTVAFPLRAFVETKVRFSNCLDMLASSKLE